MIYGTVRPFDPEDMYADQIQVEDVKPVHPKIILEAGTHAGWNVHDKFLNFTLPIEKNPMYVIDVKPEPYLNSEYNIVRTASPYLNRQPGSVTASRGNDVRTFIRPTGDMRTFARILDTEKFAEFKKDPRGFVLSGKMTKKVFTCRLLEELIVTPRKGLYQYPPQNYHLISPYGGGKTTAALEYIIKHRHMGIIYVTDNMEEWENRVRPFFRDNGIMCEMNVLKRSADVNVMDIWHYMLFDQANPEYWCLRWPLVFLDVNYMPLITPIIRYEFLDKIEIFLNNMGLTYGIYGYEYHPEDIQRELDLAIYNKGKRKKNRIQFKSKYEVYDPDVNCNMSRFMDYIIRELTWDDILGIESTSSEEGAKILETLKSIQPQTGITDSNMEDDNRTYIDHKYWFRGLAYALAHKSAMIATPPFLLKERKKALCMHPMNPYFNHMYQSNVWLCSEYGADFIQETFAPYSARFLIGADKFMDNVIGHVDVNKFYVKRWGKVGISIPEFKDHLRTTGRLICMQRELREAGNKARRDSGDLSVSRSQMAQMVTWLDHWPSNAIEGIFKNIISTQGLSPSLLHDKPENIIDSLMRRVDINGYRYVRIAVKNDMYREIFEAWLLRKIEKMPYEARPEYEVVDYSCIRKAQGEKWVPRLVICVDMDLMDLNHGGFYRLLVADFFNKTNSARDDQVRCDLQVLKMCMEQGYARMKRQIDLGGQCRQDRTDVVYVLGTTEWSYVKNKLGMSVDHIVNLDPIPMRSASAAKATSSESGKSLINT